jgi:hypothetical protein
MFILANYAGCSDEEILSVKGWLEPLLVCFSSLRHPPAATGLDKPAGYPLCSAALPHIIAHSSSVSYPSPNFRAADRSGQPESGSGGLKARRKQPESGPPPGTTASNLI